MYAILFVFFFIFGATVGSFLNVCIYRIPRKKSIIAPGSLCPQCQSKLHFWDLIPLFSYIFLHGRCRYCNERISIQYFFVELWTAVMFLALFYIFGLSINFLSYIVLTSLLIIAFGTDLEFQIIPDRITYSGIIAGVLFDIYKIHTGRVSPFSFPLHFGNSYYTMNIPQSILGIIIGGGIFLLIAVISRGGMGGGDVKLAALIGAFMGVKGALISFFFAFFWGALAGILLIMLKKKSRKDYIPFGPALVVGVITVIFWGNKILNWYITNIWQ